MGSQKVKLSDIAQYTGVSVSTVSRVLNNKNRVDPKVRERVLDAVKTLNYIPNEVARSLKKRSTEAIGVIVNDITNSFFSKVVRGIEDYAYKNGYYTIVCNSDSLLEREISYTQMFLKLNVCGLIVDTRCKTPKMELMYEQAGIPIVYIDNKPMWETQCSTVTINNYLCAKNLVQTLIDHGHKDIAIINENESACWTATERRRGWENALKEAGIKVKSNFIVNTTYKNANIENCLKDLFLKKEMPTAILATNNTIAYSVLKFAFNHNIRIPEDLSIVCFDADDDYGIMRPRLSGLIQPALEMGKVAAQILINMNRENGVKVCEQITLKTTEVAGDTVRDLWEENNCNGKRSI